jgi:amicoumacin kinase
MESRIREQYNDHILFDFAARYQTDPSRLALLDGFESYIYEYAAHGNSYILRVSHSLHRPSAQIGAEIAWTNHLADNGLHVSRAVPSALGNLLETIDTEQGHFTAVAFEKAPGRPPEDKDWNATTFKNMGRMTGQMHALARQYEPAETDYYRPDWLQEAEGFAEAWLPASEQMTISKFNNLIRETQSLPRDDASYGLVHLDFHRGNFFLDHQDIWLFDFDDCQHSWFADDIAMALFYAVPQDCTSAEDLDFARHFLHHFMVGYRQQNNIDARCLQQIPLFLKRREMELYIIVHRSFSDGDSDEWASTFMAGRREKIENDVLYVDIPFDDV